MWTFSQVMEYLRVRGVAMPNTAQGIADLEASWAKSGTLALKVVPAAAGGYLVSHKDAEKIAASYSITM